MHRFCVLSVIFALCYVEGMGDFAQCESAIWLADWALFLQLSFCSDSVQGFAKTYGICTDSGSHF
jgi:hypothetical protein